MQSDENTDGMATHYHQFIVDLEIAKPLKGVTFFKKFATSMRFPEIYIFDVHVHTNCPCFLAVNVKLAKKKQEQGGRLSLVAPR
jgi:hypothetical protein